VAGLLHFGYLLWGTVVYRPYVYVFFACYLFFSLGHLRARDTLIYTLSAYLIAFACEYSATRNGFPFGAYVYLDGTRTQELWLSNVPFWDSLSFVFLSYFSWVLAMALIPTTASGTKREFRIAVLGGFLMMLLDVVIDPLTLLGDRWFLGKIYYYPNGGSYFGVTLSNFAGWFFVGSSTMLMFQAMARAGLTRPRDWRPFARWKIWGAYGVYAGVLAFQLAVTAWIGQWRLFAASFVVTLAVLVPCFFVLRGTRAVVGVWQTSGVGA